ncbi:serine hydrolase domain-containing protein [Desertibaculum subflavum]|uniref:serine hydrolase domain-containing protein n=1 Tax=Desertibaculum subflavum TaxID=2268458 RepID=UPI000E66E6FD
MKLARLATITLLASLLAGPVLAQGLPKADKPEDVGLSGARLKRLSDVMKAGVAKGEIPGAVVLIARNGKVGYVEAFGFRDAEAKAPMKPDAIFRLASMTKPFTSLAAMMLAEEGKLEIAYPVSRYLPEFKDLKVGVEVRDGGGTINLTTEPVKREMTVQDLMRHTSGLTYGVFGQSEVKKQYNAAKALDAGQTNAELVAKLSKIPLQYQPGTTWEYSMSTDVLARVVEVASGMDFDQFVATRIAKPLKLADSGFWVEQAKQGRIAAPPKGVNVPVVTAKPNWFSGGGGMVGTAADYVRFCQMLLNGGQLDGVRLVSRKTIELMTANHLPPGIQYGAATPVLFQALAPTPEFGQGFGLGFAVRTDTGRNPLHGSQGDYFWGGAYGTYFWIDPKEKLIAILMMQAPAARLHYRYLMREMVYQAIVN